MAKLYQHQMDETYYTKLLLRSNNRAGFVTRQIHPDGVAYLKYCGVRVGQEIPPDCVSVLWDYNWLHTKDDVPHWGEVKWAPRWTSVRPRPLRELRPFRSTRSVSDWMEDGDVGTPRSAADDLQAEIQSIRERNARQAEELQKAMRAETEARLQRIREEGQRKVEAARKERERNLAEEKALQGRKAKPARTRRAAASGTKGQNGTIDRRNGARTSAPWPEPVPARAVAATRHSGASSTVQQDVSRSTPPTISLATSGVERPPGTHEATGPAPSLQMESPSTPDLLPGFESGVQEIAPPMGMPMQTSVSQPAGSMVAAVAAAELAVQPAPSGHLPAASSSLTAGARGPRYILQSRQEVERGQDPFLPEARWSLDVWILLLVVVVLLWFWEPSLAIVLAALVIAFKLTGFVRRVLRNLMSDGSHVEF